MSFPHPECGVEVYERSGVLIEVDGDILHTVERHLEQIVSQRDRLLALVEELQMWKQNHLDNLTGQIVGG